LKNDVSADPQDNIRPIVELPGKHRRRSARPPAFVAPEPQRWLSNAAAHRLLDVAAEFEAEDLAVVARILPPFLKRTERDRAISELVPFYVVDPVVPTSGRALATVIAAHCQRPPPPGDPRRPLIDYILANSRGRRAPGFETVRQALAGLTPQRLGRKQVLDLPTAPARTTK
jgi:hypothetical protein